MVKISCVVPLYNQAQYLDDCLRSIENQTRKADEVFVVNDGSTDNSLSVASKYPFKVITQVNKGLSSARNTGIMNATGDYIVFLDSDDIMLPNYLERIEKEDADVIAPSFRCFGVQNAEIILMQDPKIQDFREANRIGYCTAIKRSVLLECGGYSPRMIYGYEDYHLWFDLLHRGKKIKTIQEVLWLYRTKEKSMIHDAMAHHQELMAQISKDFPDMQKVVETPLPRN